MTETTGINTGSIKIETLTLSNYEGVTTNIMPLVSEFSIFESINQPFISAEILIMDSLALTSVWPIIGQELINLKFKTGHDAFVKSIDLELRVVSVENLRNVNIRTEAFVLRCVAPEMIQNQITKIRKSFAKKPLHETAKDIFDQYLLSNKTLTTKESIGNRTIVIPNMSPSRALKMIGNEAYAGKASQYLFFQNNDGFYFTTIDELIDNRLNSIVDKYNTLDMNTNPESSPRSIISGAHGGAAFQSNKPFDYLKIKSFQFDTLFNYNRTQLLGGIESTVRFLDPVSSTYYEKIYNYHKDWQSFSHTSRGVAQKMLTESNPYVGTNEARTEFLITNAGQLNEYQNDQKTEFWHFSQASKALLENTVVTVTLPGDSEKRAGQIIDLSLPEFGGTDDILGKENRYVSGRYLILSVRHKYNPGGYEIILQCSKNAFEREIGEKY